jgi:hypothetical protein
VSGDLETKRPLSKMDIRLSRAMGLMMVQWGFTSEQALARLDDDAEWEDGEVARTAALEANEQDVLYRYAMSELKAEGLGLKLRATRTDFVARRSDQQEVFRVATLDQVEKALDDYTARIASPGFVG